MSAAHGKRHKLISAELDDLLDEALADKRIKERLARPYKVNTSYDIPLLGSSAVGGGTVYIDRHLPRLLPVGKRKLENRPGLIKHERLEQALEDIFGWKYDLAHDVATHYEERDYRAKGFDPAAVEKAYAPYIKADEHEKIVKVPVDLDVRPMLTDKELMARVRAAQGKEETPNRATGGRLAADDDTKSMPVGLAKNPQGVPFRCGACQFFDAGKCWNKNPDLHGRKVEPQWCCNLYKHDKMEIIIR